MAILIVDDDDGLRRALSIMLEESGYSVLCARGGAEAVQTALCNDIECAVLDVMMPGMDGFELCARLRESDPDMGILMLSAKHDIVDKKHGFRAGADDYLAKPFDEDELLLRVGALLRRRNRSTAKADADVLLADREDTLAEKPRPRVVEVAGLVIDMERARVSVDGVPVQLTRKEYDIVLTLASRPGSVFTRQDIVSAAWGDEFTESSISIPTYIRHLRTKLERDPASPKIIQTVFGFGYRLGD